MAYLCSGVRTTRARSSVSELSGSTSLHLLQGHVIVLSVAGGRIHNMINRTSLILDEV